MKWGKREDLDKYYHVEKFVCSDKDQYKYVDKLTPSYLYIAMA
jgi:hypothetical protein